ncbi:MAG: Cell surface protein [Labilithrix sp.]|nr:Cell surface protein [Labilithrix sp.]
MLARLSFLVSFAALTSTGALALAACGSDDAASEDAPDRRTPIDLGDAAYLDVAEQDGSKAEVDGGFPGPDGSVLRKDRFATSVVSFTPGDCAGYGSLAMPGVVLGPPVGSGTSGGGTDVVSLGYHGEIVLSVAPNAIVDGPGPDLLVFENAFLYGPESRPFAELGEVSVSAEGVTWKAFPCDAAAPGPTYGSCAGWHPVLAAPGNGRSPVDPAAAGGDPFDLADVGIAEARFVRIRDLSPAGACPANPADRASNVGFDLDAIAVVNAREP